MTITTPDPNRDKAGQFVPGSSGNPNGRPKGLADKRSELRALLLPHAEGLINTAIELAKNGDINALRLLIERLIPRPKDEAISISLPSGDLKDPKTLLEAGVALIEFVAAGAVTPEQAKTISSIFEIHRKNIEVDDLANRIAAIEGRLNANKIKKRLP